MKVVHITPWYPTPSHPLSGIWIQRQIDALAPYVEQEVLHIPAFSGPWRLREWRTGQWIKKQLRSRKADVYNVHIAYPALVYGHRLPASVRERLVITEHWSSYRYHFHSTKKLSRIKRMFRRGWPLITVSQRLANDIEAFAGHIIESKYILPNVVDDSIFRPGKQGREKRLVMGSYWKSPKDPVKAIQALDTWLTHQPDWSVDLFGLGPLRTQILTAVSTAENSSRFTWHGELDSPAIAALLGRSNGFIHVSAYETFSVVCAEALACGTPVLYSPNGALPEVVGEDGKALPDNRDWAEIFDDFIQRSWNFEDIARRAEMRFSPEAVGKGYFAVLEELCRSRANTY